MKEKFIPQCNPKANYLSHKKEIDYAIKRVLSSGKYIIGEEVEKFEKEFADFVGTKYAISVANGTDAVELALRACDIGTGDYVVTVSHTAVATVSAIRRTGASPLFCDIDKNNFCMSPDSLSELLQIGKNKGLRIKAVIPVHLYGHPADMKKIVRIARKYNISIIEDCAQAHGAKIEEQHVGTFGDAGAFSFYPTKNLGAIGDGGAVVTNSDNIAKKIKLLRQYGWESRYVSSIEGLNSRLDEIQATILRVKLKYLETENSRRRELARQYNQLLKDKNIIRPEEQTSCCHVYHQYVIRCPNRDNLQKLFFNNGIATLIHYPMAVHQQPAYKNFPLFVHLKNTEEIICQILSLPMFPELKKEEIMRICSVL